MVKIFDHRILLVSTRPCAQSLLATANSETTLEFTPRTRTEEEYFGILRDRIIECICRETLDKKMGWFHGVDMIKRCARGFLDERGVQQYEFSGEHEYYRHVLERIYRPLAERGLIQENENNNFTIPTNSRLHDICRRELAEKQYIRWEDFRLQL